MFTNALCYEGPLFADFFKKNFYLNIFGCAGSLWPRRLFRSCSGWRLLSRCNGVWASPRGGFSCWRPRLGLLEVGFRSCASQTLGHRLHHYGVRAQLLCSTWDLPTPGLNPCLPPSHQESPLFTDCNPPPLPLCPPFSFCARDGGGEARPVLTVVSAGNPHFKFTSLPKFLAFARLPP